MAITRIIVLSAPSGTGKTSLAALLRKRLPILETSVSCTTRVPRPGEKHGMDYRFLSEKEFSRLRGKDAFVEWACVYGNCYGTLATMVEEIGRRGKIALLVIDIQGGLQVKRAFPSAFLVGILPPSAAEQKLRLIKRGEPVENIPVRLAEASAERKALREKYDARVVNADLEKTAARLAALIRKRFSLP